MKKIIGVFFIFALFSVGSIVYRSTSSSVPQVQKPNQRQQRHASVEVILSETDKKVFQNIPYSDDLTALDLTKGALTVQTKGEGTNAFVTKIEDKTAEDSQNEFWKLLINGKESEVGAGSYVVKDNDTITWQIAHY